ncbi:MAG: hypothetical protein J0J15_19925 [Mesorhizobium sp.]|nr:hypothetical protein [Mesorhizobium sp.]
MATSKSITANKQELLDIEKGFWTGDEAFFATNADTECLVAFPEMARTMSNAELAGTDMPVGVLEAFEASLVRDVYLVCRRGPERTRFTAKELRELGELGDCDVVVDGSDLPLAEATFPAPVASNLRILRELSDRAHLTHR